MWTPGGPGAFGPVRALLCDLRSGPPVSRGLGLSQNTVLSSSKGLPPLLTA